MTSQHLRWTVIVSFQVDGDSLELALEAAKLTLRDFARPVIPLSMHEVLPVETGVW
jgi:hypothetical protein